MKYDFSAVKEVTKEMLNLGIPAHLKGYQYVRTSVMIILQDEMAVTSPTKLLYPQVAKIHETTDQKVERDIRYVIEIVWNRSPEHFNEYFNSKWTVRPTNSEFLAALKEVVKQHIK